MPDACFSVQCFTALRVFLRYVGRMAWIASAAATLTLKLSTISVTGSVVFGMIGGTANEYGIVATLWHSLRILRGSPEPSPPRTRTVGSVEHENPLLALLLSTAQPTIVQSSSRADRKKSRTWSARPIGRSCNRVVARHRKWSTPQS